MADKEPVIKGMVRLEKEGEGRYVVHTPFMFDDGDHLVIVLKQEPLGWVFTDQGHTAMMYPGSTEGELHYWVNDDDFTGALCEIITRILELAVRGRIMENILNG